MTPLERLRQRDSFSLLREFPSRISRARREALDISSVPANPARHPSTSLDRKIKDRKREI
jgi:hypothetical protein